MSATLFGLSVPVGAAQIAPPFDVTEIFQYLIIGTVSGEGGDATNVGSSNELGAEQQFLSTADPNTADVFAGRWSSTTNRTTGSVPPSAPVLEGIDYTGQNAVTSLLIEKEVFLASTDFIASLPSLQEFRQLADPDRFAPLPEEWRLYCCDVVNSTSAIEAGRYKAVNMAGAACIMAAINAADGCEIGYVFGGDGATIAVPESLAPSVDAALVRTRRLANEEFSLEMRVGAVALSVIRAQGADARIAMLELSPGNRTALFSGGGAQLTDALVKGDSDGRYQLRGTDREPPDLEGLSCRWEPLMARSGHMLCLLVSALPEEPRSRADIYGELLAGIEGILKPGQDGARPVRADNMRFRWPPRGIGLERQATRGNTAAWKRGLFLYTQSFFQALAERFDWHMGKYHAPVYRAELRANSDYRRFDDVLRMILDVTPAQHRAIDALLADAHRRGEIHYGTHHSDAALMTCLLFDLKESRHLHFIDGTEGGFTRAAKAMKAQAADSSEGRSQS